jgi:hypothetical protein
MLARASLVLPTVLYTVNKARPYWRSGLCGGFPLLLNTVLLQVILMDRDSLTVHICVCVCVCVPCLSAPWIHKALV